MRIGLLVTVATLAAGRDSLAQSVSVSAQAIPLVTRADPTAGARTLTEGYLTQPVVMGHAMWSQWTGIATLNLEGLTLDRGELSTGGYGEGYVDRRHPHAFVHELLVGRSTTSDGSWAASVFAGRGFVPFGSDDPMVRPFVKYPINHHLAQVLERVVGVGAARYGPVIGEVAAFNGDEPLGPGDAPNYKRFGDSWASRVTVLPIRDVELSGSYARVASPEIRVGAGLDQRKYSLVARYDRSSPDSWRYGLAEFARTTESDAGNAVTTLSSALAEGAVCRSGVILAGRFERTDRPEEEQLLDPFRAPRPSTDLSNLGVSRWTTFTVSASPPRIGSGWLSGRFFLEVERIAAAAGTPAGLFSPELRYGTNRMWMVSAGMRLRAGSMHERMGRYGAAVPVTTMMNMEMSGMNMGEHTHGQPSSDRCRP